MKSRCVIFPKGVWDRDDILELKIDPNDSARDSFVRLNDVKPVSAASEPVDFQKQSRARVSRALL